jgi:hypothetical protein
MGDAEAGEHDTAVRAEQDVGGLHVAMHDAEGVGGAQRAEDGEGDPRGLGRFERAAPEHFVQRLTADQLHDDPRQSVLDDDVVDGDGAGMVDVGGGPGLAVEPVGGSLVALVLGIPCEPGRFEATSRSTSSSCARHTVPMPPWPSLASSR